MSFSVIIPSRNIDNLVPCVEAVRKHEPGARIIVVDDGLEFSEAVDAEEALCAPLCSFVPGFKPFIFARNINLGIREAHLEGLAMTGAVLLNDDALLQTPGGLTALAREAENHPEYGAISAVTNVAGNPAQFRQNVGLRETNTLAYVCVYLPRRTLNLVGLLDERYCLDYGCEDDDHCRAIRAAGLKVGVFDGCYVDHASLRSTYRGDPLASRSFARNHELLKQKWGLA